MAQINVFVVGLDEANRRTLEDVPEAVNYRFHGLLTVPEIQQGDIPIVELIDKAKRELAEFDGEIGAIVGYWDFPSTSIVPILCADYGLPGASLQAVLKCEHKYWSRLEQSKVTDAIPRFGIVDLTNPVLPNGLSYSLWLKPVKSFSSELAFKVTSDEEFALAAKEIGEGIDRIGMPFEYVMEQVDLPPEIEEIGGAACLAEEAMSGLQAATEGYVYGGEVVVTGALDSIDYPGRSSFQRHQYPSELSADITDRMTEISIAVIGQIGLDNSTFSIEFFCDPEVGDVRLLEVNARHSQSHAELFEYVDGYPNHYCMLRIGLGQDPTLPHREGPYAVAAKWEYRKFEDAYVTRVPTPEDLEQLYCEIPGVAVDIEAVQGNFLSKLSAQDSYSYELAHVYIGADDIDELKAKYQKVIDGLPFEFTEEGATS